jgi:hypothetical protein
MDQVALIFEENRNYFPTTSNNWVVCAVFKNEIALLGQQKIMESMLKSLSLSSALSTYVVDPLREASFPGKGSVFVDGKGPVPIVYVEDKVVSTDSVWSSNQAGSSLDYNTTSSPGYLTESLTYGSTTYKAGPSSSGSTGTSSQTPQGRHYFIHNKIYYYYNGVNAIPQSERPKKVWVHNENGWSGANGQEWRYIDGKIVKYR